MRYFTKILIVLLFGGFCFSILLASVYGWGVSGMTSRKTQSEIQQNCPNYYQNPRGDCLGRTFRSFYLIRSVRGGGFGGGK